MYDNDSDIDDVDDNDSDIDNIDEIRRFDNEDDHCIQSDDIESDTAVETQKLKLVSIWKES